MVPVIWLVSVRTVAAGNEGEAIWSDKAAAALILFIRSRSASSLEGERIGSGPGVPEGLIEGVLPADAGCASRPVD